MTDNCFNHFLQITLSCRYSKKSVLITSLLPVERWHNNLVDPTLTDVTLDRLVHNTLRRALSGDSMRKHAAATAAVTNTVNV